MVNNLFCVTNTKCNVLIKAIFKMAGNGRDLPKTNVNITEFIYLNNPSEWFYRCEGLWTVAVFNRKIRKVLRLRKAKSCKKSTCLNEEDYFRLALNNLEFAEHVLRPLMGHHYMRVGELVSLPEGFASAMNDICRNYRPSHRLDKQIAESCSFGVIMPDFCFVPFPSTVEGTLKEKDKTGNPTFAVEIKPKCGFLPTSPFIDSTKAIKYSVCHYCMLQKSKVKEGKYRRESKYCPIDLFSGDPGRVMYALESLVSDPQNNLRIFRNGVAIFTEELVWEAIKRESSCCAEKYLEMVLNDNNFSHGSYCKCEHAVNGMYPIHKKHVAMESYEIYNGVSTECDKGEHGVTTESDTCCNGVTSNGVDYTGFVIKKCKKCVESVTREYHYCKDGVSPDTQKFEEGITSDSHRCGHVGPYARHFLGIFLEILINDSKQVELSPNKQLLMSSTASQSCKGSKYPDSKLSTSRNLSKLHFGNGGVFKQLLSVQKLDDINIEGIFQLYQKVVSHFNSNQEVRERLCVNGPYVSPLWKSVASSFDCRDSEMSENITDSCSGTTNIPFPMLNVDLQDGKVLYQAVLKICQFAVASTAKDSSVMIAFQETSNVDKGVPSIRTTSGSTFHYNIALVDLDPKGFDRVLKYYNDSNNAVKNYLE